MIALDDIPTTRLLVRCGFCQRVGAYCVARLMAQHGAAHPLAAFLAEMRARCGRPDCAAVLCVPLALDLTHSPADANLFTIDTWLREDALAGHEMQIGSVYNYEVAKAAFARAIAVWPHSTITLRHGAQIFRAHRPSEERARTFQAALFQRLGLR